MSQYIRAGEYKLTPLQVAALKGIRRGLYEQQASGLTLAHHGWLSRKYLRDRYTFEERSLSDEMIAMHRGVLSDDDLKLVDPDTGKKVRPKPVRILSSVNALEKRGLVETRFTNGVSPNIAGGSIEAVAVTTKGSGAILALQQEGHI